jgi:hypothetical protein
MPWCDSCSKFWNPTSMAEGGACPTCGRVIAETPETTASDEPAVPWHFKLLLVALVIYLGFRAYQGVIWVVHHV